MRTCLSYSHERVLMTVYLQRVVTAYESRLADAKRETAGLKAELSQLEKEHSALPNEQVYVD